MIQIITTHLHCKPLFTYNVNVKIHGMQRYYHVYIQDIETGVTKIIFTTPELASTTSKDIWKRVACIAIDEVHCLITW